MEGRDGTVALAATRCVRWSRSDTLRMVTPAMYTCVVATLPVCEKPREMSVAISTSDKAEKQVIKLRALFCGRVYGRSTIELGVRAHLILLSAD